MKKLSEDTRSRIFELLDEGRSMASIAKELGIAVQTVKNHKLKRALAESPDDEDEDESPELTIEEAEELAKAASFAASIDPGEHGRAAVTAIRLLQNLTEGDTE